MIASSGRSNRPGQSATLGRDGPAQGQGKSVMARLEMLEFSLAGSGEAHATVDTMFELGMMHASGRDVPVDLITAHKWFNIAATKGHAEAIQLRREIAAEMSDAQIGQAQRAARDWLKANPAPAAPVMMFRAAA
jgi:TPR repeat protein